MQTILLTRSVCNHLHYDFYGGLFSVEMSEKNEVIKTFNFTKSDALQLKECFKSEINSRRRFEKIQTVADLFIALENRLALTDDVLLKVEPNFQKFIEYQRSKAIYPKKLVLPKTVVTLICDNCLSEKENLGKHLKLTEEEIHQCCNIEDVLMKFSQKCVGISQQEMIFKLNRALGKCGKEKLKSLIIELTEQLTL